MKKYILSIVPLLLLLSMFSCDDPLEGTIFTTYDEEPIGVYLENHEEYASYVQLLRKANLLNALNVKTAFTCFAVDNEGVNQYLALNGLTSVDQIDQATANSLVRYHIIPGASYMHSSFSGTIPDSTASGDYLTVKYKDGGINAMYVNDYSLILHKDIVALNGYIHQIDRLLEPITATIWDIVNNDPRYSIFKQALITCKYDQVLNSRYKTMGLMTLKDYKTVLVVSDSVFNAHGIASYDQLLTRFPATANEGEVSPLNNFMGYHILKSNSDFAALATFDKDLKEKVKNVGTYAYGTLITIRDKDRELWFNYASSDPVRMVENQYDMQAVNGFVHQIDKLLVESDPERAQVVWQLTDNDVCRVLPEYRKYGGVIASFKLENDPKNEIRWQTIPEKDNAVQYHHRSGFVNEDAEALIVNLGYVGWYEVDMPVIAKGKYKMKLRNCGWVSSRGQCQMYIDGTKVGGILNFNGTDNWVQLGEINFQRSEGHTFRFSAVYPGNMEMDCIIFEPIN